MGAGAGAGAAAGLRDAGAAHGRGARIAGGQRSGKRATGAARQGARRASTSVPGEGACSAGGAPCCTAHCPGVAMAAAPWMATAPSALLALPVELLLHVLRFVPLRGMGHVARTCPRLHALRGEYVWHAALRDYSSEPRRLERLIAARCPLPRAWPAGLGDAPAIEALVKHDHGASLDLPPGAWAALARATRLSSGATLLHYAAKYGKVDRVRALLERGADVNAKDEDDQTPLHWAAQSGHVDCVRALLERGADVNVSPRPRRRPFTWRSAMAAWTACGCCSSMAPT